MSNFNWNYPTTMWGGENRIKDLNKACKQLNMKKPLIVTDGGLVKNKMILETTSFSNLQNMEKQGLFKESVINKKTDSKVNFFHLGPKNKWQDILDKKIVSEIEKIQSDDPRRTTSPWILWNHNPPQPKSERLDWGIGKPSLRLEMGWVVWLYLPPSRPQIWRRPSAASTTAGRAPSAPAPLLRNP